MLLANNGNINSTKTQGRVNVHLRMFYPREYYSNQSKDLSTNYLNLLNITERKDNVRKKSGLSGIRTLDLCDTGAVL